MEKLIQLELNGWPKFQEQLRKSYHTTQEESKRPETDNVVKTENRLDSPTKTILPNYNTPKPKPQRSPIHPPTFEVNNGKNETKKTSPKRNDQPIHESETQANLIATEKYRTNQKPTGSNRI